MVWKIAVDNVNFIKKKKKNYYKIADNDILKYKAD